MEKAITYFNCKNCGKEKHYQTSQKNTYKNAGSFCSRECHYEYRRKNPSLKGHKDSFGYLVVSVAGKRIRQHRYIVEKNIGRKLLKSEHVHHINGVKDDNRLENLVILNKIDHHKQTYLENKEFYDKCFKKASKVRWDKYRGKWSMKHDRCISCGLTENRHQGKGLCSKCYLKKYAEEMLSGD